MKTLRGQIFNSNYYASGIPVLTLEIMPEGKNEVNDLIKIEDDQILQNLQKKYNIIYQSGIPNTAKLKNNNIVIGKVGEKYHFLYGEFNLPLVEDLTKNLINYPDAFTSGEARNLNVIIVEIRHHIDELNEHNLQYNPINISILKNEAISFIDDFLKRSKNHQPNVMMGIIKSELLKNF